MKKILILLITLPIILLPVKVFALNDMSIRFETSFFENVNVGDIEEIYIMMDDKDDKDYEITLERKNNFNLNMDNMVNGDIIINNMVIKGDHINKYTLDSNILRISDTELKVSIIVSLTEKNTNTTKASVKPEVIDKINNDSDIIVIDDEDDTTKKSTTISTKKTASLEDDNERLEKEKEEYIKKEQKIKKRDNIYLKVLIGVIIFLLVIGILVVVKILNANK